MKILFVNSCLSDGGSERVMTLIANELFRRGNSVEMVLVRGNKQDTYKLDKGIRCVRFEYKATKRALIAIERIKKLRSIVASNNYDLVVSFMYDINCTLLLACLGLKTKIIVSERADPQVRWKKPYKKWLETLLYKKAKHIVFQTDYVMNLYPHELRKKSSVIPNPANPDLPKRYMGEREKIITAVGRLEEQKNFGLLIKAFSQIHRKFPDYKLYIYGRGSEEAYLKETALRYGIGDCVEFPGYVDRVYEKVNKSAIYVSTSNYEGISNTMVEALAMGVPTICTDCPVGGARLMIQNNQNGILINLNDDVALCNAMLKLLNDESFSHRISDNALKVREEYSIETIGNQWENLIQSIVAHNE